MTHSTMYTCEWRLEFCSPSFLLDCSCGPNLLPWITPIACCGPAVFLNLRRQYLIAVLVGAFVMLVSASLLGMNLACQFSHTKRHREMIFRATQKFYAGYL